MALIDLASLRSAHLKSIVTLVGGTMGAQAITILTAPILTRLYNPADYGLLGVFMSVTLVFATFGTLQYAAAIVLASNDDSARSLIFLGTAVSCVVAAIALVLALLLRAPAAVWLDQPGVASWFLALPLPIALSGLNATLGGWLNRQKRYKTLASARFASAVSGSLASVAAGFALHGPLGLLIGYIAGHVVLGCGLVVDVLRRDGLALARDVSVASMRAAALEQRRFPLFSLPTEFLNTFVNQTPLIVISSFAGASAVGAYSMGQRILALPIALVAGSVGEVFSQRAAAEFARTGECRALFVASLKNGVLFALPVFLVLGIAGADVFAFVFGEKWRVAGEFIRILAPMMMIRFIVSPLTVLYSIASRQREDLVLHIVMAAVVPGAMVAGWLVTHRAEGLLAGFSVAYALLYAIYLWRSYQFAVGDVERPSPAAA